MLTPKRHGRDNWFRAVDDPELQGFMLQAHKLRSAYEKHRERYRELHPHVTKAQLKEKHDPA
jgi:hypothetical protein